MGERNYYVICEDNCKFPAMTKEQVLTAIEQAISTGKIQDVDTGFVTKIKEQNSGKALSFWIGTNAEYNAIEKKETNCFYIITDDTTGAELRREIEELKKAVYVERKGIPPLAEIIVTAQAGAIECTDANGEKIDGLIDGNVWRFKISEYGTYKIVGAYEVFTETKTVEVAAVQQYFVSINYYNDIFAENDWATIIKAIQGDSVPDTWKVGDEKGGYLIIGKYHDEYIDGTKAPITFLNINEPTSWEPMHNETYSSSITASWKNSYMRKTVLAGTKFNGADIKSVKKRTYSYVESAVESTNDKQFLLSEVEMFGEAKYSKAGEGKQYEYFKNGNGAVDTWLRSPFDEIRYIDVSNGKRYEKTANENNEYLYAFCL